MARRLLGIGAFLLMISIMSAVIVVVIQWIIRVIQFAEYHGDDTITDFLLWPLQGTVANRELVFLGWMAFFIGIASIFIHIFVSFIKRFFRKSILVDIPENPEYYRKEGVKIVAVIPAFEEKESISDVILGTRQYVDEIVVVDDGSRDGTCEIAIDLGTHIIQHDRRRGLGITMRDGLDRAVQLGADVIVTLDADGQYVCDEIPNVIYPITNGQAELVLGSRSAGHIEHMPLVKRFGNRMMTWAVGLIAKLRFTDTQTGFRAMTAGVARALNLKGQYTYTQEMVLQTVRNGYRVVDVPITFRKRLYGDSRLIATSFDYAFQSLGIVLRTMRDENPLMFFGSGGLLLMAVDGFFMGDAAIKWSQRADISAQTVILAILFVSVGLQILLFGFLTDMLRKERSEREYEILEKISEASRRLEKIEDQKNR